MKLNTSSFFLGKDLLDFQWRGLGLNPRRSRCTWGLQSQSGPWSGSSGQPSQKTGLHQKWGSYAIGHVINADQILLLNCIKDQLKIFVANLRIDLMDRTRWHRQILSFSLSGLVVRLEYLETTQGYKHRD